MKPIKEKRIWNRIKTDIPVKLFDEIHYQIQEGRIPDISASGAKIETNREFLPSSNIMFAFSIEDQILRIQAQILWTLYKQKEKKYLMGLQFLPNQAQKIKWIKKYLRSNE